MTRLDEAVERVGRVAKAMDTHVLHFALRSTYGKSAPNAKFADDLRAILALSPVLGGVEQVAWRVKDFADGWILVHSEAEARSEAEGAGNRVEPLYTLPTPPKEGHDR